MTKFQVTYVYGKFEENNTLTIKPAKPFTVNARNKAEAREKADTRELADKLRIDNLPVFEIRVETFKPGKVAEETREVKMRSLFDMSKYQRESESIAAFKES